MNAYSEDLRKKIVEALGRGMGESEAARTFSVSLSSIKRYAKKRPGSAPKLDEKAMKPLEEELRERPFVSLRERCEYIGAMMGLSR
jgi:transposase